MLISSISISVANSLTEISQSLISSCDLGLLYRRITDRIRALYYRPTPGKTKLRYARLAHSLFCPSAPDPCPHRIHHRVVGTTEDKAVAAEQSEPRITRLMRRKLSNVKHVRGTRTMTHLNRCMSPCYTLPSSRLVDFAAPRRLQLEPHTRTDDSSPKPLLGHFGICLARA